MTAPRSPRAAMALPTVPVLPTVPGLPALLALLAGLAAGGCAGAAEPAPRPTPTAGGAEASPTAGADPTAGSLAEIEALYRARMDSARARFTDADVRFMTGMIHHHAQALEMSRLAPSRGASGSIRTLAARIINAQKDEIATMQEWLRDRGQPVPEVHETAAGVMVHGGRDAGHADHGEAALMPGMLTPDQMRQLERTHGPAFDRLFLTYMIQHHQGAVTMVHDLFATDGAAQDEVVFKFASDVQVDQATEIARMERMLATMSDTDPPSPNPNQHENPT